MSQDPAISDPSPAVTEILAHLEAGRLRTALDTADSALAHCPPDETAMLLCMKCNALVTLGKPLEALRVATAARELAIARNDPPLVAEAGLALSFALQSLEEHSRAIDMAADCERIAEELQDQELLARSLRTLGISYSVLGRHEQAMELLERVISLLQQHARTPERLYHARYSLITARSRLTSGNGQVPLDNQAQYRELLQHWLNFVHDAETRNLVRLKAMALGNAGIAARYAGDLDQALDILDKTLELQYSMGLRGHAAVMESHVGATLKSLNRHHEAIAAFKRAIELFEGGNPRELAGTLEELAGAYEAIDEPRAALNALKEARALERKLQDDAALVAATKQEKKAEIARLAEQWTRLADEDALTGLGNRRTFDRHLLRLIEAAQRDGVFALVLFDLDHFKRVNDTHGHGAGDQVLRRFAAILRSDRRNGDVAARIGGEEFALLLAADSPVQALAVAEKIRHTVAAEPWAQVVPDFNVTVSGGVACSDELSPSARTQDQILALADRRLYAAKHAGRNRIVHTG